MVREQLPQLPFPQRVQGPGIHPGLDRPVDAVLGLLVLEPGEPGIPHEEALVTGAGLVPADVLVDLGGTVVDVSVRHNVYGKMEAQLNIFSRHQVKQFIEGVRMGKSTELMNITGGYHYHTVRADSEDVLDKIEKALKDKNYIIPED
jgi:hypothetical protein